MVMLYKSEIANRDYNYFYFSMVPKIDPKQVTDLINNLTELTARVDNLSTANSEINGDSGMNKLIEAMNKLTLKVDSSTID